MWHRNLVPGSESTTAAIVDVLDRGTLADWRDLARRIRDDPTGEYARKVRRILEHTHFYGTSILWLDYLDRRIRSH